MPENPETKLPTGAVTTPPSAAEPAPSGNGQSGTPSTVAVAPAPKRTLGSTFEALQYANYRNLWFGNLFGGGALWIQQITVPWLVYDLTGSGAMLGLINGMFTLPIALVAPFSGAMADRVDRKKILITAQVYLGMLSVLFAVDVGLDYVEVWHVFVFVLLIGAGFGFMFTTGQTLIPTTVPRKAIVNAVALNNTSLNATRAIGPAVGGQLIATFGIAGNFFVQAACYFLGLIFLFRVKLDPVPKIAVRPPFFQTMQEGFKYVGSDKAILALIIMGLGPTLFLFPTGALMPIFAVDVFHRGAQGFGILLTAIGVGALIGALSVAAIGEVRRKGIIMYALLFAAFGMVLLFAWTRSLPLALLVLGLQGAFQTAYLAIQGSTLQLKVPNQMLGRVMSVSMLNIAMFPLGGLVGGQLADVMSGPWAVTILALGGITFVAATIVALPAFRKL
ncbi:MAG: MFS transporter [Dehalococcoidia bacterium]|nr:MFS transporter [Dehalococcoidia bacterium]